MTDSSVSRRRALVGLGAGALSALLAACSKAIDSQAAGSSSSSPGTSTSAPGRSAGTASQASCTITPELTEGPYYLDLNLVRQDITEGRPGAPLELTFTAVDADGCTPLTNAAIDIWHCDAAGAYSGVSGAASATFLRGTQVTDARGQATFTTIYPGWYQGRAVHIHFKVHPSATSEMTGQLFFPDELNASVYSDAPYNARGRADTPNARDSIYGQSKGATLLAPAKTGDGYTASITVAVGPTGGSQRRA